MYTELDRRTRLAELEAEFYRPKERDGVRVREPGVIERMVMAVLAGLRRHGTEPRRAPTKAVRQGVSVAK
jgi:hypothetical protein